jgi:hypothetical protein
MWADYSRLEFFKSNDYYKSDIVIAFGRYQHGDSYPFDGPGFVLAHAYYPYELGSYGGDIHFDEDENWNPEAAVSSSQQGLDFFTVAVCYKAVPCKFSGSSMMYYARSRILGDVAVCLACRGSVTAEQQLSRSDLSAAVAWEGGAL